jgi:hypothetical protein
MPIAMTAPATAPQSPPVLARPPQNPVAIFGIKSEWIFLLSATESRTLSAQRYPEAKYSPLLFETFSTIFSTDLLFSMIYSLSLRPNRPAAAIDFSLAFLIVSYSIFFRIGKPLQACFGI